MSRLEPTLSHLFFANDLFIFCKSDEKHDQLLKEILNNFCEVFDNKVNARKTNMFFSKRVEEFMTNMLNNLLAFQKVHNLGHYLRIPFFHQRVTNSTMYFGVEKVRMNLQS